MMRKRMSLKKKKVTIKSYNKKYIKLKKTENKAVNLDDSSCLKPGQYTAGSVSLPVKRNKYFVIINNQHWPLSRGFVISALREAL